MPEHTRDETPAAGQQSPASCCPLPAGVSPLPATDGLGADEAARLATAAKALSDPIRLRMLAQMTAAQCCRGPEGVCVCELQSLYGLAQSKVSYHLKVLREAGLVHETRRGKWSFYAVDEAAARAALTGLGSLPGLPQVSAEAALRHLRQPLRPQAQRGQGVGGAKATPHDPLHAHLCLLAQPGRDLLQHLHPRGDEGRRVGLQEAARRADHVLHQELQRGRGPLLPELHGQAAHGVTLHNVLPERHTSGRVELQNPERVPTRFATSERAETL